MPDRGSTCTVEVGLAADIGGDNDFGVLAFQGIELVVAQLPRQFGLGQRISARRAAAQVTVGNRREVEAQTDQNRFLYLCLSTSH